MIPFIALSLTTLYKRHNYLENFLMISYVTGQLLWLSILIIGVHSFTGYNAQFVGIIINSVFITWVIGSMNPQKNIIWRYLKGLLAWFVGYIFFMIAVMLISFVAAFIMIMQQQ